MLLALVAVTTQLTGQRSWKIIKFLIHQSRPHHEARNAMIKEQEIGLRLTETDMGTCQQMWSLLWGWRNFGTMLPDWAKDQLLNKARQSTRAVLLLSLVHALGFIFLSAMVPTILGDVDYPEVLVRSKDCAIWTYPSLYNPKKSITKEGHEGPIVKHQSRRASTALSYYQNCYEGEAAVDCRVFIRKRLHWTESVAKCPVNRSLCYLNNEHEAVVFDTGSIELAEMGLNSAVAKSLQAQRKLTCSPITLNSFELKDPAHNEPSFNFSDRPWQRDHAGFLWREQWQELFPLTRSTRNSWEYIVRFITRPGKRKSGEPVFHESLQRQDGDTVIILIQKDGVQFTHVLDDPIFRTEPMFYLSNVYHKVLALYHAYSNFTAIACVDQMRVYNDRTKAWSPYHGTSWSVKDADSDLHFEADQETAIYFLNWMFQKSDLRLVSKLPSSTYLDARSESTGPGLQFELPPDQWIRECRRWFGISLAALQIESLTSAIGAFFPEETEGFPNLLDKPQWRAEKELFCNQLKFHSAEHITVNLFGLCCYILLATMVWVLSLSDGFIGRRLFKLWPHRVLAWQLDSSRHLIRQLHERTTTEPPNVAHMRFASAYGTLGVPIAVRENGNYLKARYSRADSVGAIPFNDLSSMARIASEKHITKAL